MSTEIDSNRLIFPGLAGLYRCGSSYAYAFMRFATGAVLAPHGKAFSNRKMLDSVVAATPAGRLGTDEDMADAIIFLCSQASRYIHGQTIELNGGFYMV